MPERLIITSRYRIKFHLSVRFAINTSISTLVFLSRFVKKQDIKRFGVCYLSVIPLWLKPENHSYMVSQILFGEFVEVISIRSKHSIKVRCLYDQLTGYLDPKQIWFFTDEESLPLQDPHAVTMELSYPAFNKDLAVNLLLGSSLPRFDGISSWLIKEKFSYSGQAMHKPTELIPQDLFLKVLRRFLMSPQLDGGRTVFGLDSPAFVQLVFKIFHIHLPRYTMNQLDFGSPVFFARDSKIGDLVFCENKQGELDHVGIVIDRKKVIHVHGQVRIDKLDHHGIFNLDERRYTHKVRLIKRIENWLSTEELDQSIKPVKNEN